jgi:hypothetical protein
MKLKDITERERQAAHPDAIWWVVPARSRLVQDERVKAPSPQGAIRVVEAESRGKWRHGWPRPAV